MEGVVFVGLFILSTVFALGSFVMMHDSEHDASCDRGGMPSLFSSRVISLFLVGFSSMGALAHYAWKMPVGLASLSGVGAGAVLGGLTYAIIVMFHKSEGSG